MKPSSLKEVAGKLLKKKHPVLLVGPPGVGKSDIMEQVSDEMDADLVISHPVVSDPVDFKGFPFVIDGEADFIPFGDLKILIEASRLTIFFMDDLGQAPASVQAAAMQLLLARRIGRHMVSPHIAFVAASNRRQDKAGVQGILEPVKSRFVSILNFDVDLEDWVTWALKNKVPPELIGFIRFRPNLLLDFKPSKDMVNSPCPRTVAAVGKVLQCGIDKKNLYEVISGSAGEGFAAEFTGFLKLYETLPDLNAILASPSTAEVPTEAATLYAICIALASKASKKTIGPICEYIKKLPTEFGVLLINDATKMNPEISETKAWMAWTEKNYEVLLG